MGKYNFDEIINRKNTDSLKYGALKERFGKNDLMPLWVADMDFKCPPELIERMTDRVKQGIFGYPVISESYYQAIINWQKKRHNWKVLKEEICYIPGIVKGIAFALDTFTKEGDKIIIQPPVYHPFKNITQMRDREVILNPLLFNGIQYEMDFIQLEEVLKQNCKILILSNPHNPGGRVWKKEELQKLAELCSKYGVLVISDEIHSDLAFNEHKHIPFASISDLAAQNCITFNAPSKTFNIAGLVSSYSIIKNKEIRDQFHSFLVKSELNEGTIFSYLAVEAVYEHGEDWLNELKNYLWENIMFINDFIKTNIPQIKVVIPEASFLVWLDCRELKLSQQELVTLFIDHAHLALNNGTMFGKEGTGFMRMNIGCSQKLLTQALEQLKNAYDKLVLH